MTFHSVCSCSGLVKLSTVAPDRKGVFASGESVSPLLQDPLYFLPTCYHDDLVKYQQDLTLSKLNGDVWFQEKNVTVFPARLIPLRPAQLTPNLTGVYECQGSKETKPSNRYELQVVGKTKSQCRMFCVLSQDQVTISFV